MKIKVFEAFAGYGSQRMALRNLLLDFDVVGISEIERNVILSYAAIHTDYLNIINNENLYSNISREEMIKYLEKINVPLDYKTFENKASKLNSSKLREMYIANILSNNFGDIKVINPNELPDIDLFTYSFPCQDISVAGYQNGLEQNSGTRSSLLWECCKIIEAKKPKYLMMENVKNLVGKNHKDNFLKFLNYLETLGYNNSWDILNAKDYGIPQNRERVFCISIYQGTKKFNFPKEIELEKSLYDILEKNVDKSNYLKNGQQLDHPINQKVSYCLDSNYWKGVTLNSFLEKHRRQLVTDVENNGIFIPRRLTPRETWRLMGVKEDDIDKAIIVNENTSLYKQAGNSIVVNVLEAIFKELFIDGKY